MRSAQPKKVSINLLPQDPFYETPVGRVMAWASTVGRYLVIFTELIVIISFGSRFKLDRDLTDLNTAIRQKSQIVDLYGDLESSVRIVQAKTLFLSQQKAIYDPRLLLNALTKSLPQDVALTLVQIHPAEIQVTGTAITPESLAKLVRNLQRQSIFESLFVDQIKSDVEGNSGFEFVLHILLKKTAGSFTPSTPAPTQAKPVAPDTGDSGL